MSEGEREQRQRMVDVIYEETRAAICAARGLTPERFDELAEVLLVEGGKVIKDARGEVQRLIDTFSQAAGRRPGSAGRGGGPDGSAGRSDRSATDPGQR